jgi:hypothetical protein
MSPKELMCIDFVRLHEDGKIEGFLGRLSACRFLERVRGSIAEREFVDS